ncbi:MAG: hypothetical protein PHV85_00145 [Desulfovibrionaceae bacterium]|nr:hypothetical protein [Desulfovibrionaceae bacterium]
MAKEYMNTNRAAQTPTNWFNYADSNSEVVSRLAAAFNPSQQSTPDMTVLLAAGSMLVDGERVEVETQSTGTITAPSGNPRIDLVYIDQETGVVGVATGSEAAEPEEPALPEGKLPIAAVSLATTTTSIDNSLITDVRVAVLPQPAALLIDNNLSDLADPATACGNLGAGATGLDLWALSNVGAAWTLLGLGTAAGVDTGSNAGDVPLLQAGGLLDIARLLLASQEQAEAGTDNASVMTPLRVAQAIAELAGGGMNVKLTYTAAGTDPTGTTDITGLGFTPLAVVSLAISTKDSTDNGAMSIGFSDGTYNYCISVSLVDSQVKTGSYALYLYEGASNYETATLSDFDSDGFTVNWTKGGDGPSGTVYLYTLAIG